MSETEILVGVITAISKKLIDAEKMLTELDSPIGDADCGTGVKRGFTAVQNEIASLHGMEPPDILKKVGFTLACTIGGTSGAMLGTGFIETGKSLADKTDLSLSSISTAMEHALSVIKRRGGNTEKGDKTLVDSLEPAVNSFRASAVGGNTDMVSVLEEALARARAGSDDTVEMIAKKGRASYLGERSKGHRDPGTVVICLMFEAAYEYLQSIK